jgi:hypothetical protein
VMCF